MSFNNTIFAALSFSHLELYYFTLLFISFSVIISLDDNFYFQLRRSFIYFNLKFTI